MAVRLLTINIRKYLVNQPRTKRAKRINTFIKHRIAKSTNLKTDNIKISKELNSIILKRYVSSMKPIKLSVNIDKDKANISYFEEKKAAVAPAQPAQQVIVQPKEAKAASPAAEHKAAKDTQSKEIKNTTDTKK